MLIEATEQPVRYRLKSGEEVVLRPGVPIDLPDQAAQHLLKQAKEKVKVVPHKPVTVEPAVQPNGNPLTPIYWETGDGRILGPAVPEFLGRDGNSYWISLTFEGQVWWINSDRLRSKQQWAEQKPMVEVDRHLLKA